MSNRYPPQYNIPEEMKIFAEAYPLLRLAKSEESTKTFWKEDLSNRTINPITAEDIKDLIYKQCKDFPTVVREDIFRAWKSEKALSNVLELKGIPAVAFKSDPGFCFTRLEVDPDGTVELSNIPEFADLLARSNASKQIVLFIGSLLDPTSGRKQYLHLSGKGDDGKSVLCDGLSNVFGKAFATTNSIDMKGQHWGADFEGKRLLVFPDENNPSFIQNGTFKRLTGDTRYTINPKGLQRRTIEIQSKVIITSNSRLTIENEISDRCRAIPVTITSKDFDINWRPRFLASMPSILSYCFSEYKKAIYENPNVRIVIPVPEGNIEAAIAESTESTEDAVDQLLTSDFEILGDFRSEKYHYELDESGTCKKTEIYRDIQKCLGLRSLRGKELERVISVLSQNKIVQQKNVRPRVYKGIKRVEGPRKQKSTSTFALDPLKSKGGTA